MKITIIEWLSFQKTLKDLSVDGELSLETKMDVVSAMEEMNAKLKPFFTVRQEVIEKYKSKDEDGKDVIDIEKANKEITDLAKKDIEIAIDSFKLETSKDDKTVTAAMLGLFKEIFWDKFELVTK